MVNFMLLLTLAFLFFSYMLGSLNFVFAFSILIIIGTILKYTYRSISISKGDFLWFICTYVNIIGCINSPVFIEAVIFAGIVLILTLLKICLSNFTQWKILFLKTSLIFSAIHVLSTIFQRVQTNFITMVNNYILSTPAFLSNQSQLLRGKFAGITGQVGVNAFYITIFICLVFCYLLEARSMKKRLLSGFFLLIAFTALLLTTKRGLLLFNVATIVIIAIIHKYFRLTKNNQLVLYTMLFIIFGILIWIAVPIIGNGSFYQRYLIDEDISSGRVYIYSSVVDLIRVSPLVGNGIGSVESILGIKGHNIYLQLWAEVGLFGFIIYIAAIMTTLFTTIKLYSSLKISENQLMMNYLILVSIYIQLIFIFYGLTGNPLFDYFMFGFYIIAASLPGTIKLERVKVQQHIKISY